MYGQKQSSFGGFGTSPSPFGGLGQSSSGFGGGSAFGTQPPGTGSSLFGGGASGSTGTTGGGLFGTGTNTFGGTQNSGGFSFGGSSGNNSTGGLFGGTSQTATGTSSLFSTPASGTGFGNRPAGFGAFGSTPSQSNTGLFGTGTGTTPSLFGQASATTAFGGTAAGGTTLPFNPLSGQDTMMKGGVTTNISTRHQCITAMKEYENKSLEELRVEDYTANRKLKQAGSTSTGGLFGTTPTSQTTSGGGFVFGTGLGTGLSTSTTGFGGFGNTSSAATTPFSQNRPLFGTATTTQSGFGFGTATGTQQPTSLFGSAARPLFGGTSSTQSSLTGAGSSFFGAPAAAASNPVGFGTSTAQTGGLFGTAKPAGFGTATTSSLGFGTGGNLFAKPTSTASSFGFGTNTSTTGFGGPSSGGGLFNLKPVGFGAPSTGLGTTGTSFGFGSGLGTGSTTNTFGTSTAKPAFGGFNFGGGTSGSTGFGTTLGTGTGTGTFNLGGGITTLGINTPATSQANSTQHLLALASSPYGDNPLFWNLKQQAKERRDDALKPTNPNAQKAVLSSANQYKVSPRPTAKIKPKSLHNLINGGKAQLFEGLEDEDFSFGDDTFVPRKSVKKLVLRKDSSKTTAGSSSIYSDAMGDFLQQPDDQCSHNSAPSLMPITRPLSLSQQENIRDNEADANIHGQSTPTPVRSSVTQHDNLDDSLLNLTQNPNNSINQPSSNRLSAADTTTSFLDNSDLDNSCQPVDRSTPHPTGVILTRPGYYTMPALDDMIELIDENGNCYVEDLTIGRDGYGTIFFPGITNVAGMNIDEIVHFRRKEVVVYPDDDKKPPLGQGLNKKAEITLDCVWPVDKTTRTPIKSPERLKVMNYGEKIEDITSRIGGKFLDYRPETGSWVFQVTHFSKYGLLDDSDEDELTEQQKLLLAGQQPKDTLLVQKLKVQQQEVAKQMEQAKKDKILKSMQMNLQTEDQDMLQGEDDEDILGEDDGFDMLDTDEIMPKKHMSDFLDQDVLESSMDSKFMASSYGIKARDIQGMKASFFGGEFEDNQAIRIKKLKQKIREEVDDYDDDMQSVWKKSGERMSTSLFGSFKHPATLSLPQSPAFSDKEPYGKEGYEPVSFGKAGLFDISVSKELPRPTPQTFRQPPVMEHKLIPSGLQPQDILPRIVGTRVRHAILHVKDSLLYRNQETLVDAACFMGRSFRVGWGPSWTVVHSGNPLGIAEEDTEEITLLPPLKGRIKTSPRLKNWTAHVEQIQVADYMNHRDIQILEQQEDLLKIQLDHSRVTVEDGCPLFVSEPGVEALQKLAECVKDGLADMNSHPDAAVQEQMKMVFCLCVALWGNLPDADDLDKEEIYREQQLRREALSQWLSETSAAKVAAEMEASSDISSQSCLRAVFSKLTVREISEACMLAQRGRDHRLALLLAQATGSCVARQMVEMQLHKWAELDACQFISELRQKIYCLLAGHLVWCSREQNINTCDGLDWKRALALHLWYKSPSNASIQHALRQYQHGFQGSGKSPAYCATPLPPYLEEAGDGKEEGIFDTAYHLMCLYADKSYSLEALLSPASSTASHLDFRLSWHLLQVLQALQYSHISPYHSDTIHVSFASQLEALGLWHWAAFILLHITDSFQRQKATVTLLQRHLQVGEVLTERETFLIDKLQVPAKWLHQAKAIRARHEGNHDAEARHWILASDYNTGHITVIRHIAADAIINSNDSYLKSYLDELAPPERSLGILNWASNGKVFLDFINIRQRLEELKQSEPSAYDLEELQPDVISLCARVSGLTCLNSKDRLCQAEMAKTSANLIRTFKMLCNESPVRLLIKHIPDLPLPEDYALQELQALTRAALLEMV